MRRTYYSFMSNRTFQSADEAAAWSTFYAAQCPRIAGLPGKNIERELAAAANGADEMLHAWRERAYVPTEIELTVQGGEEAPPTPSDDEPTPPAPADEPTPPAPAAEETPKPARGKRRYEAKPPAGE